MNAGHHYNKAFYYVDKTRLVRRFLEVRHRFQLVTAPQGFLKSSNLRLLATFLDDTDDGKAIMKRTRAFVNSKIMEDGMVVGNFYGQWPTIFITFNQRETYDVQKMIEVFRQLYKQKDFLLSSPRLSRDDKSKFRAYLNYQSTTLGSSETKLSDAVPVLCVLLHKHFGRRVYIFIDNYDAPILNSLNNNECMYNFLPFLEKMLSAIATCKKLMRILMSGTISVSRLGAMKFTEFKFLSNNQYAKYFGFTERNLHELAVRCSAEVVDDLKKGCYCTAFNTKIYSPEWVLSRLNYSPIENPYWYENIVKKQIYHIPALKITLRLLVQGEDITFGINRYKSAKDIWMINKLMNGTPDEDIERADVNLLLSLFLELGLFTFIRRRRRTVRVPLPCLETRPTPKLILNDTSRGSEILKIQFSSPRLQTNR